METAALLRQAGRIVREAGARLEDRSLAGFLAPARGLFLRKVYY